MSKQKWAAIIYGRSYHLDFRFITIPSDFSDREIAWVSPYILASTQKARNLSDSPRWSLFKNHSHCVVGVTCMVRDLIGKMGEDLLEIMAKDDVGRPLYVFVGYVTQLNLGEDLDDVPVYSQSNLNSFKPLYREIEKVWFLRDYDNREALASQYKPLDDRVETTDPFSHISQIAQLNDLEKHPDKTFVWRSCDLNDGQLWLETARCSQATSICLNIKGKFLSNSPFLNQTATKISQFEIEERLVERQARTSNLSALAHQGDRIESQQSDSPSFKEKISARAKEDIDLTIQQAAKLTSSGQEIIGNLTDWSNYSKKTAENTNLSLNSKDKIDNFGFKNKKDLLPSQREDWF